MQAVGSADSLALAATGGTPTATPVNKSPVSVNYPRSAYVQALLAKADQNLPLIVSVASRGPLAAPSRG